MSDSFQPIKTDYGVQFNYNIDDKKYNIEIYYPTVHSSYNIPYILVLPEKLDEKCFLAVEANNLETENTDELLANGLFTAKNLVTKLKEFNTPVLVPLLPSVETKVPYYQQLSRECFNISEDNIYYRIDLQVANIISEAKDRVSNLAKVNDKIFLNGYSSSGVFAQRFALLHPKKIGIACIGGASGSIPIPTSQLEYPLGTKDFTTITGKDFDEENYSKISFRYYVGELEDMPKSNERFDEEGNKAPKHDMSYFERSVPNSVGYYQREMFGKNLLERSTMQIELLKNMGIDIEQKIMKGRSHNNQSGLGVNELGDKFVNESYRELFNKTKKL